MQLTKAELMCSFRGRMQLAAEEAAAEEQRRKTRCSAIRGTRQQAGCTVVLIGMVVSTLRAKVALTRSKYQCTRDTAHCFVG